MSNTAPSPFDNPPPIPPEEMDAHQLALDSYYNTADGEPLTQAEAERQLRDQATEDLGRFAVATSAAHQEAGTPITHNYAPNADPDTNPDPDADPATAPGRENELLKNTLDKTYAPPERRTPPALSNKEIQDFNNLLDEIEASRTRPVFNDRKQAIEQVITTGKDGKPHVEFVRKTRTSAEISEAMTKPFVDEMSKKIDENPRYRTLVEDRLSLWQGHVNDAAKKHDAATADMKKAEKHIATRESEARRLAGTERDDYPLDERYNPDSIAFKKSLSEARKISDPTKRQERINYLHDQADRYRDESVSPRYNSWFNDPEHKKKWLPPNARDMRPTATKRNTLSEDRAAVELHNSNVSAAPTLTANARLKRALIANEAGLTQHNVHESNHRSNFLQGIYDRALNQNYIIDGNTLESIMPDEAALAEKTKEDLFDMWETYRENGTYTVEAEHKVFGDLEKARNALEHLDWYLYNTDTKSAGYQEFQQLRTELLHTYYHGRYLREMMRAGQADRNDEQGRFTPTFEDDRGIALNDGTSVVLYPDFSYSVVNNQGDRTRYMHDGSLWQPVNFAPEQAPEDLSQENNRQLVRQFNETMEDWFVTQDAGLGSKARNMARELRERNEEAFNNKPDHPQYDQRATLYAYWEKFLATGTPEADAAEATLWRDGSVVTHDTYYSHPHGARVAGMWRLHASKRKQLLQPDTLA